MTDTALDSLDNRTNVDDEPWGYCVDGEGLGTYLARWEASCFWKVGGMIATILFAEPREEFLSHNDNECGRPSILSDALRNTLALPKRNVSGPL